LHFLLKEKKKINNFNYLFLNKMSGTNSTLVNRVNSLSRNVATLQNQTTGKQYSKILSDNVIYKGEQLSDSLISSKNKAVLSRFTVSGQDVNLESNLNIDGTLTVNTINQNTTNQTTLDVDVFPSVIVQTTADVEAAISISTDTATTKILDHEEIKIFSNDGSISSSQLTEISSDISGLESSVSSLESSVSNISNETETAIITSLGPLETTVNNISSDVSNITRDENTTTITGATILNDLTVVDNLTVLGTTSNIQQTTVNVEIIESLVINTDMGVPINITGDAAIQVQTDSNTVYILQNDKINILADNGNIESSQLTEISSDISSLQSSVSDTSTIVNSSLTPLSTSVDTISTVLSTELSTVISDVSSDISTVSAELSTNISDVSAELSTNISDVSADISTVSNVLSTELSTSISTVSAELSTNISDVSADISTVSNVLSTELSTSISTVSAELSTNISDVSADISTVSNVLSTELSTSISDVSADISTVSAELSTNISDVSADISTVSNVLSTDISILSSDVTVLVSDQLSPIETKVTDISHETNGETTIANTTNVDNLNVTGNISTVVYPDLDATITTIETQVTDISYETNGETTIANTTNVDNLNVTGNISTVIFSDLDAEVSSIASNTAVIRFTQTQYGEGLNTYVTQTTELVQDNNITSHGISSIFKADIIEIQNEIITPQISTDQLGVTNQNNEDVLKVATDLQMGGSDKLISYGSYERQDGQISSGIIGTSYLIKREQLSFNGTDTNGHTKNVEFGVVPGEIYMISIQLEGLGDSNRIFEPVFIGYVLTSKQEVIPTVMVELDDVTVSLSGSTAIISIEFSETIDAIMTAAGIVDRGTFNVEEYLIVKLTKM